MKREAQGAGSLAANAGLLTISQYASAAVGLLMNAIAARVLGPGDYGTASLIIAYCTLVWGFTGTKSVSVTTRYIAAFRSSGEIQQLAGICRLGIALDVSSSLVAVALIAATGWWLAEDVLQIPGTSGLMVAYAASFPFYSLVGTGWAVLSSYGRFQLLSVLQVAEKAFGLVVMMILFRAGLGISAVVMAAAAGHVLVGLAMAVATTDTLHRSGTGLWWGRVTTATGQVRRELVSFLSWNYLLVTIVGLANQAPLLILGWMRAAEEAGFYRLATSLVGVESYVGGALGRVAYPILATRWRSEASETVRERLVLWTWRGGLPLAALAVFVIPALNVLVPFLFGSAYRPAVPAMQVLTIGTAVSLAFFWLHSFYYASGRIRLWTKAYTVRSLVVTAASLLVVRQWGLLGLAVVTSFGSAIFAISMAIPCLAPRRLLATQQVIDSACVSAGERSDDGRQHD